MGEIIFDIIFKQCHTLLCLLAFQSNGPLGFLCFWMSLNSAENKGGHDLMEEEAADHEWVSGGIDAGLSLLAGKCIMR